MSQYVKELVAAISAAVVADLAQGGQLPLTVRRDGSAGRILLGRQHDFDQSDAPRIIFVPVKNEFGPKDLSDGGPNAARLRPQTERVIGTNKVTFEVECWGRGVPDATGGTSPDDDYNATMALAESVLAMVHITCVGSYAFDGGSWVDGDKNESHHIRRGRYFVFNLTLNTPIFARTLPANLLSPVPAPNPPSNYVTPGTTRGETLTLTNPAGTSGTETITGA